MEDFSLDTSLSSLTEQQFNDFKSFLREGTYFLRDKNWKNGEKCFSEALKINYDSYEANLGKLFCKLKICSFAEKSNINNVAKLKEFVNTYNSANNTDKIHLLQWVEENSKFVRTKRLKVFLTTISCFIATIALALATFLVIIPRVYHYKAVNAIEQKDYLSAYENLQHSMKYKDSAELLDDFELIQIKNAEIGDVLYIGDSEPYGWRPDCNKYNWRVIAKEDSKILLHSIRADCFIISKYSEFYKDEEERVGFQNGWVNSGIRNELNGRFFDIVFDDKIKSRIITTTLTDTNNSSNMIQDKIFILSEEEFNFYLSTYKWKCSNHWYLLRNASDDIFSVVDKDGSINKHKYTHNIPSNDLNGDEKISFSELEEWGHKYSDKSQDNAHILSSYYRPAMWVDISNIDL